MLKYFNYDIVFREIPNHVTLAINITNCPNHCVGCHSPHLQQDVGEVLDENLLDSLLDRYATSITCFCFMGGDQDPHRVAQLAKYVQRCWPDIKTAWYSGCDKLPAGFDLQAFQYIKLGRYDERYGPLDSPFSNQHFYEIQPHGAMEDLRHLFCLRAF